MADDIQGGWHVLIKNMTYTCVNIENHIHTGGILHGDNPLKHTFPLFIFMIAFAQIVSQLIYILLSPLKQPKFVCYLLGGILLGPTGLGYNNLYMKFMFQARERILLDVTSNLGLIYFLFLTMVKMDAPITLRRSKKAWGIGVSSILVPMIGNVLVFSVSSNVHTYMNGSAPIMVSSFILTHFPNVVHVLDELHLLSSEVGSIALSAAAVNEIIVWSSLPFTTLVRNGGISQTIFVIISLVAMVILFFLVRMALLRVASRIPEGRELGETYVASILLGALVVMVVTHSFGLILIGAILFGLCIPKGPPIGTTLVDKSEVFIMEFLMPVFYLYVGLHTDISLLLKDRKGTVMVLFLSLTLSLLKFMGAMLPAALYYKIRFRQSCMIGLLLNVRGVMELIFLRRWKEREILDNQAYTVMVLAHLVITAVSVPILDSLKNQDGVSILPLRGSMAIQKSLHGPELRVVACIHSEENVHGMITLIEASNPTEISPICTYVVHLVELVGRAVPLVVPYKRQTKMLRSQSAHHIMRAFDNYSSSSHGTVILKPFTIIAPYRSMHENIGNLAAKKAAHLIVVPFRKKQEEDVREVTFLRNLNANIQAYAPCTVGVLVDNGLHHCVRHNDFLLNVAVIFIGGPDDREALAYATRVSGREGIQVTVIRIRLTSLVTDIDDAGRRENKLDESVLEGFKIKNVNNNLAVYQQLEAEDGVHVVNLVKSLELNYDLMILGRVPGNGSIFKEDFFSLEMLNFLEHPELGVIGDMLSSEGFLGETTSMLVMQHFSYY